WRRRRRARPASTRRCWGCCAARRRSTRSPTEPGVLAGSPPADDVAPGIDLLAEDAQLLAGRGRGDGERLGRAQLEAGAGRDAREGDAGVQAGDLHAPGLLVVAEDGEVGDDAVGPGARRQAGRLPRPGAGEVAGRGEEVELLDEAAGVVVGDD